MWGTPFSIARCSRAEDKFCANLAKLIVPEFILVEDISRIDLRRYAACEVFDRLACLATNEGGIAPMCFRQGFLK